MLEGAIAYFLATGRRRLLDILERYVDAHPPDLRPGAGPEARLLRAPGDRAGADQALPPDRRAQAARPRQPISSTSAAGSRTISTPEARARGEDPKDFWAKSYEYNQSHKPVREQDKVVGHAVRAMYMYSAMADLAAELGDDSLKRACEVLWHDVMASKIYITSGLGPAAANEGFTEDYDLPNDTAYAETCASVALIFWAQRMLHLDLDGKICRRDGAGAVQRRAHRPVARRRALFLLQSARQRRPAQPLGLAHLPVLHDERRRGWSPRSAAISSRRATTPSPSTSMAASRPPSRSPAARSRCARSAPIPGRATSASRSSPRRPPSSL